MNKSDADQILSGEKKTPFPRVIHPLGFVDGLRPFRFRPVRTSLRNRWLSWFLRLVLAVL
jgi:hypothetical protein